MERDVIISVRGLRNQFGTQIIHDRLDLDIYAGEVLGIVGGSGTGKSVLLRTILGLNKPATGRIEIFGKARSEMTREEEHAVERRWGVLFQDGALFSSLTVAQNIQVALKEHLHLPQRLLDEISAVKIGLVGLPPEAGPKFPSELSGGMRKRAGLARVFAQHRQMLPDNFQLTGEVGLISDFNFLEQYFEDEFDESKDVETLLHGKQQVDNWTWSILARPDVNGFENTTEWLPRGDRRLELIDCLLRAIPSGFRGHRL